MADKLFPEEALAYQSASSAQFGETTGFLPPSWGRITLLFAVFMAALLVFLFSVSFARKETVRGKLRFDGAEAKVFALEPGIVANVFVSDEQIVAAGDPLFEIRSERSLTDGRVLSDQVLATLARERDSLAGQISALTDSAGLSRASTELAREDALRRKGGSKPSASSSPSALMLRSGAATTSPFFGKKASWPNRCSTNARKPSSS